MKPLHSVCLSRHHTVRKANCESPRQQKKPHFMLQDGEIDHCQREGNQSD